MRVEQLRQLLRAHQELIEKRVGVAGKIGFLGNSELSAGWRSSTLQKQLVARGASEKMSSNHRRGVSVDSHADKAYIQTIEPTMNKFGFFRSKNRPNHWNWISAKHCRQYPFIDHVPVVIENVSMYQYENTLIRFEDTGKVKRYAIVRDGKKQIINMKSKKALELLFDCYMQGVRSEFVDKKTWESIPDEKE